MRYQMTVILYSKTVYYFNSLHLPLNVMQHYLAGASDRAFQLVQRPLIARATRKIQNPAIAVHHIPDIRQRSPYGNVDALENAARLMVNLVQYYVTRYSKCEMNEKTRTNKITFWSLSQLSITMSML